MKPIKLANVSSIDYSNLESLSNGTYNKGEITLHRGIFGGYSFEKVNNHVGSRADKNTVVRTADQNLQTKAAVFKAIVTRFAKSYEQRLVERVFDYSTASSTFREALASFSNPYIKESYAFLMGDGAPLTRDEMRLLDNMLKDGGREFDKIPKGMEFRPTREFAPGEVSGRMETLKALKRVKVGDVGGLSDDVVERAKEWIKGLSVANISNVTKSRVMDVSTNVLANTSSYVNPVDSVIVRYMPKLHNSCMENVLKVSWPTEGQTVDKKGILKIVRCITAGLDEKINTGWEAYEKAVPEEDRPMVRANGRSANNLRPVTKDDIKTSILSTIDHILRKMGKCNLASKVPMPVQDAALAEMNRFEKRIYESLSGLERDEYGEPDWNDILGDSESEMNESIGEWD